MTWLSPLIRLAANVSDHFTPTQNRQRELAKLVKRRDKLLESQKTWTKEDSVELDRVVDRIARLSGLLKAK